jgi:hypothetical protein
VSGSEANIGWDFKNKGASGDIHENKGAGKTRAKCREKRLGAHRSKAVDVRAQP